MTQIIPDIINIVIEAIFAILGLFFTGVAIPWLVKTGIPVSYTHLTLPTNSRV